MLLQTRRNVDAVAKQIRAVYDDITHVDRATQLKADAFDRRQTCDGGLYLQRCQRCLDRASELYQESIAEGLEYAAASASQQRIDLTPPR